MLALSIKKLQEGEKAAKKIADTSNIVSLIHGLANKTIHQNHNQKKERDGENTVRHLKQQSVQPPSKKFVSYKLMKIAIDLALSKVPRRYPKTTIKPFISTQSTFLSCFQIRGLL